MVTIYAQQLSLAKPNYVTRLRDLLSLPKAKTKGRRTSAYKYRGIAFTRSNLIFLNVKRAKSRADLKYIIAHECAHLRFPYLSHGSRFRELVDQIIRGRQFKSYRPQKGNPRSK
ncbi:MAG: YgjP-like metallopeptidase domain-containing protein [Nitrososphaerales archaeon]